MEHCILHALLLLSLAAGAALGFGDAPSLFNVFGAIGLTCSLIPFAALARTLKDVHKSFVSFLLVLNCSFAIVALLVKGDSWAAILATTAFFIICLSTCGYFEKGFSAEKGRSVIRKPILVSSFLTFLTSGFCFAVFVYRFAERTPSAFALVSALVTALQCLCFAWLFVKMISADNIWLFKRVARTKPCGHPLGAGDLSSLDDPNLKFSAFFLSMLMTPSIYTRRIREDIKPRIGTFNVNTEYVVEVPKGLRDKDLVLPAIVQNKYELTSELTLTDCNGRRLQRLADGDTEKCLAKAIYLLLVRKVDQGSERIQLLAGRIASSVMGSFSHDEIKDLIKEINSLQSDEYVASIATFLKVMVRNFNEVKPICVRVSPAERVGANLSGLEEFDGFSPSDGFVCIKANRNVPLVPIRNKLSGNFDKFGRGFVRFLTKKRMTYYFNLGNADRARSYHLTFSGPDHSYYVESGIKVLSRSALPFIFAERMAMTNRYDQQSSRLYVRNGKGFCNAALLFSYEDRSHQPIQAVCASAALCLGLVCFVGFSYLRKEGTIFSEIGSMTVFFSVMTLAGLMSVWSTLGEKRSEEWLWLSAFATMLIPMLSLGYLVVYGATEWGFIGDGANTFGKMFWGSMVVLSYMVFLVTVAALFERVKQHGAFMYRTPKTYLLEDYDDPANLVAKPSGEAATVSRNPSPYYRLYDTAWSDGWLVPIWASCIDVYMTSTNAFMTFARNNCSGKVKIWLDGLSNLSVSGV